MGAIIDRSVFTRVGGVLLGLSSLAGCSLCSETQRSQTVSGRGDRATVLVRDCGATTDFATAVQVGRFFKTEVVTMNGQPEPGVKWSPDGATLTITIPRSVLAKDVFVKTRQVRGVNVIVERE